MLLTPLGLFLAAFGAIGRMWCSVFISGYKTNKLITAGPYAMCRNPLYFFSLLGTVGVGMTTDTLWVPLVLATGFVLYYPSVVLGEERRLAELHGEDYRRYCQQTPRFFPAWSRLYEPEEYTVRPDVIRKSIMDAVWFIWGVAVIKLVQVLHDTGLLPVVWFFY